MQKRKKETTTKPVEKVKRTCWFCDNKEAPNYKETENLRRFVTTRAKIVARKRSGVCARHQRRLAQEVKRARHIGLLAFQGEL